MTKVEIYTTLTCFFCAHAVSLFSAKNIVIKKIDVTFKIAKKQGMRVRANGQTSVPQIFIDDDHIGGCDDVLRLNQTGLMDKLLSLMTLV